MTHSPLRLGIDIGGTSIKYGLVNPETGALTGTVEQLPTPDGATPAALIVALREVLAHAQEWEQAPASDSPVGVAFPAIIRHGQACSAANISDEWIGVNVNELLSTALQRPVNTINDADAAGLAEAAHSSRAQRTSTQEAGTQSSSQSPTEVVLVLTLGTGIGSALIVNGQLIPNFELGHLELDGNKAEAGASAVARERDGLDWEAYAARLQRYLSHVEFLFSPDRIILGGGISVRHEEFLPHIRLNVPVVPAQLHNSAGVVGAALAAA